MKNRKRINETGETKWPIGEDSQKIDGEEKRTNLKQRKEKEQFGNSWK